MRLIAFGESFVQGAGDPDHLGWVGRAIAGRREISLYNLGVRREASDRLVLRWEAEARLRLVDYEPMRIVFSFGCNDSQLVEGAPRVAVAQSLKHARAMLTGAQRLAPVLMVGPPPVADPGVCARTEALNAALLALCARLQVPFIDVFRPLEAGGLWQAEAAAWDGAHPGAAGYQQMADLVAVHPAWRRFTALAE
ncbi:MAG: GDSL-type esterase/lipase family protein [Phenylobacterium sp.]|uniref:GDSL-type esterase/lipase family protein n=1 Tax=Phenylobacterium sp. TaxID=1871053 RepID=UPI002722584C|nr:GDSL-type esterase/lipase family protein [Phenylobacterium sp.]MDO9431307.1 GDSL-type esterase/lipase family protein [Phenylobacterium sp.]